MVRRLVPVVLGVVALVFGAPGAGADAIQQCAGPSGVPLDPGTVQLASPATIDPGPQKLKVAAFEHEVQLVTLTASASDGISPVPVATTNNNLQTVVVEFDVVATAGTIYTIGWTATFDFGAVSCASQQPDHQPFTVTVAAPPTA